MKQRILLAIAIALPIAFVVILILGPGRGEKETPLPIFWNVPEFTLIDQDSTPFSSTELKGHVWVASFVYTNCPDFCPLITKHMANLRDELKRDGKLGEVRLLSITVDPVRDTPGVLRAYAQNFNAKKPDWVFLTGPFDKVVPLINEGFKLTALHNMPADSQHHAHSTVDTLPAKYTVAHTDRIVLIDKDGQVRATYQTNEPESLQQLRKDLQQLID
jgi:protein SCO1